MPRLLEVADLCSRTLSDTANMSRHGSTLCSPTVEKPLCRSPISQRSHVGNLRQTIQGKGRSSKRKGNRRCPFLFAPRGGCRNVLPSADGESPPLRFSEKLSARQGRTRLRQFAHPSQLVLKKEPHVRGEHAYAVRVPRSAGAEKTACAVRIFSVALCRENEKGTAHAVPLPSADMSAAQQQQLPQLPQPPQVLSPQVPQEPQPPLP